jgi:hypothetical protein
MHRRTSCPSLTLSLIAGLASVALACGAPARAEDSKVDNIKQVFERLSRCWRPPTAATTRPIDITVIVSFTRFGQILGHPKITYEAADATDDDRLAYRVAVMETLQRCTPMPFTEAMGGAVAGHPFTVRFRQNPPPPQPEKRAWLSPKIL